MAVDWTMKQHDLLPEMEATLTDDEGTHPDLTSTTVRFIMTDKASGVKKIDSPANIVDPTGGVVKYVWLLGDTDTVGTYNGEFEVEYPDTRLETFPNGVYLTLKIFADLGGIVQP